MARYFRSRLDNVGFDATIIEPDVLASNGVVNVLDKLVPLPSSLLEVINALPKASFSLFQTAIADSGFEASLNDVHMKGSTFFATPNAGFAGLDSRTFELLFNAGKQDQLRRLLGCHFSPNETLYSNMYHRCFLARQSEGETWASLRDDSWSGLVGPANV